MKTYLTLLFLIAAMAVSALGQDLDSAEEQSDVILVQPLDTAAQRLEELSESNSRVTQISDSLSQKIDIPLAIEDSLAESVGFVEDVRDTLTEMENYVDQLSDSLESLQKIRELEEFQADVVDSLRLLDLPEEIDHYLDSLSEFPNFHERLIHKLGEGDSSKNKKVILDKASELLSEEQNHLTHDLLPGDLTDKISQYTSNGITPEWASKATQLIDTKQWEFGGLKEKLNIDNLLQSDLDFMRDLKLNGGEFSGKLSSISSQAGQLKDVVDIKSLGGDLSDKEVGEYSEILDKMDSEEYDQLVQNYGSMSEDELDQRINDQLLKVSEMQEMRKQTSALEAMQKDHLAKMEKLREQQKLTDKIAQKKERVLANEIMKENQELVKQAQVKTDKMIGKYVKVEKANTVDGGEKLPGGAKSWGKNFVYGGNLQLIPGENISMDISPFLAYKIYEQWMAGIGGTFRYDFLKEEKYLPDFQREPVYGYRVFSQYKVIQQFFVHGEWERLSVYDEHQYKRWENNYLAGIGKEVSLKKNLGFAVMVLYNFNHKDNSSYPSPFVLRMGLKSK